MSGHDEHAGRPGRVDEPAVDRQKRVAGRGDRAGIALGMVLDAAVTWNLAANLWLPWALYVPGGLLLAAMLVGVTVKIGDEPSHSAPKPSRSMPAASSGVTRLALRQMPNRPSRLASVMQSL